jgi:hypothetical protein
VFRRNRAQGQNRSCVSGAKAWAAKRGFRGSDQARQVRHGGSRLAAEAIAEVIPECHAELGASVHEAEEGVSAVTAIVAVGTTADLSLDDVTANVAFRSVGVERNFRPLKDGEQFGLVGMQSRQQAIECDEAGAAAKDAIRACRGTTSRR